MTDSEIKKHIAQGEDSATQFKAAPIGVAKLAAELAAFTNSGGGIIYFGVQDDGSICGLTHDQVKLLDTEISNAANDNVRPSVYIQTEFHTLDDKLILLVIVPEGISKPYMDKSGNIWVKSGPDKRRVTAREELQRLLQQSALLNADAQPVRGTSFADLDRLHTRAFLERNYNLSGDIAFAGEGEEAKRVLNNLGLMRGSELSLAGLLLLSLNPQRYRPMDVAKCVAFNGNDISDTDYRDSQDFSGTIQDLYKGIMSFLSRSLPHEQAGQDFNSIGAPIVPMQALEEYVVNMLLHRDYFVSSAWKVLVFANRIELISPGSLPDNLTIEQMKSGVSLARNSLLLSCAVKDEIPYRGIGSGVRRALKLHPQVDFENDPNGLYFKTIVWLGEKGEVNSAPSKVNSENANVNIELNLSGVSPAMLTRAYKLAEAFSGREYFKRADVVELLQISGVTADKFLKLLHSRGVIAKVSGFGKGAYTL